METELQQFNKVQKYLEMLGYPGSTILFEYSTANNQFVDIVVKSNEGILIVIEVKNKLPFSSNDKEVVGFHPITRRLQKDAQDLKAEYYIVSDGTQNIWLKTGVNGRPAIISAIPFSELNATVLSESNFTYETLKHITEFLKKYSITGDLLYDISIVFYLKISNELKINPNFNQNDLVNRELRDINQDRIYSRDKIIEEALLRLTSVSFVQNKDSVLLFISDLFQKNRRDWIIPRWVADFMVKILDCHYSDRVLDVITRYGMLMTAGLLNGLNNVTSFYTNPHELYWIRIQQLLILGKEADAIFEPSVANGEIGKITNQFVEGILLAPPFNLKLSHNVDSYLTNMGVKDSTSIFLEMGLRSLNENGRLVAIVPDGFLLSSVYKKARKYFKDHACIEAIISLPQNTFAPYAAVKTSIISIINRQPNNAKGCFLAALEDSPKGISLDISNSDDATRIISNLSDYRNENNFSPSKLGIIENDLDVNNFHFTKYWFQLHYGNQKNLQEGFVPIPLKELLVRMIRGSKLVADDGGIPYIGPNVIRSMQLIEKELSYTSNEKLPKSVNTVQHNDIIINAIGPYRGCAAVVPPSLVGTPINRHIILLQTNLNIIIPGYLVIALNSKYVQDQFFDKSTGTVIPALNTKTFEEIYIPVPSMSKQEEIYNDYQLLLNKLSETQNIASKLKTQINLKLNKLGKEDKKL